MIIDMHMHIRDMGGLDEFARVLRANDARGVILGSDNWEKTSAKRNAQVFEAHRKCPDVIIPFGRLALGGPYGDTPDDIRRLKDRGAKGLKAIVPFKDYDDESFFPLYEVAQELALPILFHTGIVKSGVTDRKTARERNISSKRMQPCMLTTIACNFPDLRLIMAHMGTRAWRWEASEVLCWCKNIYADISGCGAFGTIQPLELAALLNQRGTAWDPEYRGFHQLVFGTDGKVGALDQFVDGLAAYRSFFWQLGVPKEIQHEVMYLNAARMIGLEK